MTVHHFKKALGWGVFKSGRLVFVHDRRPLTAVCFRRIRDGENLLVLRMVRRCDFMPPVDCFLVAHVADGENVKGLPLLKTAPLRFKNNYYGWLIFTQVTSTTTFIFDMRCITEKTATCGCYL